MKLINSKFSRKVDIDEVLDLFQKKLKSVRRRTVFNEVQSIINSVQDSLISHEPEDAKNPLESPPTSLAEIKKSPSKRPSPEPIVKGTTPPKIWKDLLKEDCATHKTVPLYNHKVKHEPATKADIATFKQNLKEIEKVQKESSILEEKIRDLQITKQTLEKKTAETAALKVIDNNTKKDDSFNAKFDSCDRLMQRIRSYKPTTTSQNKYSFQLNTSSNKENISKADTNVVKPKSHNHKIQTNLQPSKYAQGHAKTTNISTTVVPTLTSATHSTTTPSGTTLIKSYLNLKSPPGNPELKWIQSTDDVSSGRLKIEEDKIDPLLLDEEDDTCVAYSLNIKSLQTVSTEKSTVLQSDSPVAPEPTIKGAEIERSFTSKHEAHLKQIQTNCYDANNSLFLETIRSIQSKSATAIDSSKTLMKDNTGDDKQEECTANKEVECKTNQASNISFSKDGTRTSSDIVTTSTKDDIKSSCVNNKPHCTINQDGNNKTESLSNDDEEWFPSNNIETDDDDLTAAIYSSCLFKTNPSRTGHFVSGQSVVVPKVTMPPPPATPQLLRRLKPKLNNTPKKSFLQTQPEKYKSPFVKPSPNKVAKYRKKSYFSPSAKKSTQRFTEALLDEEVALLTCRRFQPKQERNYENPVSMFLQHGDDKHFLPLSPEVQQNKENRFCSAFSTYAT